MPWPVQPCLTRGIDKNLRIFREEDRPFERRHHNILAIRCGTKSRRGCTSHISDENGRIALTSEAVAFHAHPFITLVRLNAEFDRQASKLPTTTACVYAQLLNRIQTQIALVGTVRFCGRRRA